MPEDMIPRQEVAKVFREFLREWLDDPSHSPVNSGGYDRVPLEAIKKAGDRLGLWDSDPKREDYTIWFQQINAQKITVQAFDENDARVQARSQWREENGSPDIADIRKGAF